MPKVSIREIDNTGAETREYLNYTVLIPGPKLQYTTTDSKGTTSYHVLEGLFTKASQITNLKFVSTTPAGFETELGYLMACQLLSKGLSVYFFPAYTLTENTAATPKVLVKTLDKQVGETDSAALERIFKEFSDKGKYDLRFITIGGIDESISDAVFNKATLEAWRCAGDRGDAVAILNTPATLSNKSGFYSVYIKDGDPVEYSHDPAEGFVLTYLSQAQYENLPTEGKDACSGWTSFVTFMKTVEDPTTHVITYYYSKQATEGYLKTIIEYDDFTSLAPENQEKCTPQNEQSGTLNSATDVDT